MTKTSTSWPEPQPQWWYDFEHLYVICHPYSERLLHTAGDGFESGCPCCSGNRSLRRSWPEVSLTNPVFLLISKNKIITSNKELSLLFSAGSAPFVGAPGRASISTNTAQLNAGMRLVAERTLSPSLIFPADGGRTFIKAHCCSPGFKLLHPSAYVLNLLPSPFIRVLGGHFCRVCCIN